VGYGLRGREADKGQFRMWWRGATHYAEGQVSTKGYYKIVAEQCLAILRAKKKKIQDAVRRGGKVRQLDIPDSTLSIWLKSEEENFKKARTV